MKQYWLLRISRKSLASVLSREVVRRNLVFWEDIYEWKRCEKIYQKEAGVRKS